MRLVGGGFFLFPSPLFHKGSPFSPIYTWTSLFQFFMNEDSCIYSLTKKSKKEKGIKNVLVKAINLDFFKKNHC